VKLLVVEPRPLFPADTGAKILSGNVLRHLNRNHDVTIVVNADPRGDAKDASKMASLCGRLFTIPWKELRNFTVPFYFEVLKCLLTGDLYAVKKFCTPELKQGAAEVAGEGGFDVVLWDTISAFMPGVDFGGVPRIAIAHNIEYRLRERQAGQAAGVKVAYLRYYARKTKEFELGAFAAADHVTAVSAVDAAFIREQLGVAHVSALPPGVDATYFAPGGGESPRPTIVFTGSMDWAPNQDACAFFVGEALPRIRETVPDVRFVIVGRRPSADVRALAAADPEHVEVTGTVDDVRPYLASAHVVVVPIRFGSGIKIKVFEAMAMAKPVVVTTIGAEGLPLRHGENALIADAPEDIAARCVELLTDGDARRALGERGRATVAERHDWSVVAAELAGICERVAAERKKT